MRKEICDKLCQDNSIPIDERRCVCWRKGNKISDKVCAWAVEVEEFVKEKSGNLGETRNAALGEVRVDVKELLQMIAEIPCTCDKIYTDRKLRAPDCPRCNWVEDDIVKKASKHFA